MSQAVDWVVVQVATYFCPSQTQAQLAPPAGSNSLLALHPDWEGGHPLQLGLDFPAAPFALAIAAWQVAPMP